MGWFRPACVVRDPLGQEWELYVSRFVPPGWKQGGGGMDGSLIVAPRVGVLYAAAIPLALLGFIWACVLLPLIRFFILLPVAVVRGRRSQAVRIEAICFYPDREIRLWTTTRDQASSVVAQVAAGLEQGKVVKPLGAVYSGSRLG